MRRAVQMWETSEYWKQRAAGALRHAKYKELPAVRHRRIKGLEDSLGRPLFDRSNSGATLTPAGNQFQKHALAMVRVWQRAQLEVGLSAQHRDHLAVGAGATLWHGFLLKWVSWLRENIHQHGKKFTPGELVQRVTGKPLSHEAFMRYAWAKFGDLYDLNE